MKTFKQFIGEGVDSIGLAFYDRSGYSVHNLASMKLGLPEPKNPEESSKKKWW